MFGPFGLSLPNYGSNVHRQIQHVHHRSSREFDPRIVVPSY